MQTNLKPGESRLVSVSQLLDHHLSIPQFQRPYDWNDEQVDDFLRDMHEAQGNDIPLFLGLVVLHPDDAKGYAVIDGQQRLTTLMLAIAACGGTDKVLRATGGITQPWVSPRRNDIAYARALMKRTPEPATTLSQWLMASAFQRLCDARTLALETLLQCEVIVYVAPHLAGATRLFERINLRGKKVGEFDLVKNKLIELAAKIQASAARRKLESFITERYDTLYTLLDPKTKGRPYESDKLLKVHWILFHDSPFKSGERVLEKLGAWLSEKINKPDELAAQISHYLDSLVEVASIWVWVERPFVVSRPEHGPKLHKALLDFAKFGREGELQPLIIASIKCFGARAETLIRFCEINSLRAALAKKNSNHGRSVKWRLARQLYNQTLLDGRERPIETPEGIVHQLFWLNTPWWNHGEPLALQDNLTQEEADSEVFAADALNNPQFLTQYRTLVHFLFWKYGEYLLAAPEWKDKVRMDINPFQEAVWFNEESGCFPSWDIEHIYPQTPDDLETRIGRDFSAEMEPWLNHLGNLTVLPIKDNRGMQNAKFIRKLNWMLDQQKVPFNQLLADRSYTGNLMNTPHWGPHNCRRRLKHIRDFADVQWGSAAIQTLGVGAYDDRIRGYEGDEDDGATSPAAES